MMFPPGSATVPDKLQHLIYTCICKGQLDLFGYYWGPPATKKPIRTWEGAAQGRTGGGSPLESATPRKFQNSTWVAYD